MILTGAGSVFCAGADLSGPVYEQSFLDKLLATLRLIEDIPMPVIAALNGPALGAGLQLALAADLRVMSPSSFCAVPAAKIGVTVDEWTIKRLVSLVGAGDAAGILLGCESMSAERAHVVGFANRIGDLGEAQRWAAMIATLAPLTLRHYKLVLGDDGARDEPPPSTSRRWCWHGRATTWPKAVRRGPRDVRRSSPVTEKHSPPGESTRSSHTHQLQHVVVAPEVVDRWAHAAATSCTCRRNNSGRLRVDIRQCPNRRRRDSHVKDRHHRRSRQDRAETGETADRRRP